MWYMISSQDVENSLEKRKTVREQHIARLKQLSAEGRLMIAGPHRMSLVTQALQVHSSLLSLLL